MQQALLPAVALGDSQAIDACMKRYSNLVWSLARRFIRDRTEVEDAVQEIFIELWTNASRFNPDKGSETTFVAMLARRRLIDRMRKSGRQPATEELTAVHDIEHIDGVVDLDAKGDAARAGEIIRTLRPEQQQVIYLAVHQGHTHQSIADQMKLPLGTVKTHLRRGLLKVREAMQQQD